MPKGEKSDEPEKIAIEFKKHPEWSYDQLPLAKTGCDSYASWHPAFKDLSPFMSIDSIVHEIEMARVAQHETLFRNNLDGFVHLVITGGEPLLGWQRAYPELLKKIREKGYKNITFETNGTQKINEPLADYIFKSQIDTIHKQNFTFSVSPKLPCSGEKIEDALKPSVVADYQKYGEVYLKFVVANKEDVKNVTYFVDSYKEAGWDGDVYLMPVGGDPDLYNLTAPEVANICMTYGYLYSPRLQVDIWKNEWGT